MAETLQAKYVRVFVAVAMYWLVSISMVFVNKYLLSSKDVKLEAPFFITWFQCVFSVFACYVLGYFGSKNMQGFSMFPKFEVKMEIAKKVMPLSLVFVGMITFNNLCLKAVGVSFYNVGRSLTTAFNVVLTYFILNSKTSGMALLACLTIVFGFFLGVDQESSLADLSMIGVVYGMCASICVALNSIFVKKIMPVVDNNSWRMTLYNNLNAVILFIPLMIFSGEINIVLSFPKLFDPVFWLFMCIAGIFGIAIGLVSMYQIRQTSPLTHNISGTAKACAQTLLAVITFQETKNFLWWLSNFMVLFGALAYSTIRRNEMKKEHEKRKKMVEERNEGEDKV